MSESLQLTLHIPLDSATARNGYYQILRVTPQDFVTFTRGIPDVLCVINDTVVLDKFVATVSYYLGHCPEACMHDTDGNLIPFTKTVGVATRDISRVKG